jgi:hypothetical protein
VNPPDVKELGRRAIACKAWSIPKPEYGPDWGARPFRDDREGRTAVRWVSVQDAEGEWSWICDMSDSATLGIIEHSLLAPLGVWVERLYTDNSYGRWSWDYFITHAVLGRKPELVEYTLAGPFDIATALVIALETAPESAS